MEMQRWSSRWKTKRWILDSVVFGTLTLVLLTAGVRAGKDGTHLDSDVPEFMLMKWSLNTLDYVDWMNHLYYWITFWVFYSFF